MRLLKGTMIATHKYARATEYTVKNSGKKAKTVLDRVPGRRRLEADFAQGAGRKDPRSVSVRRRGQAGRAGQADGRARSGPTASRWLDKPRRQRDPDSISSAKVVSDKVKAALAGAGQAEARIAAGCRREAAARAADSGDRRGPGPHPPEHGPTRPQHRRLQELRQEVQRPGDRDREAPRPDCRALPIKRPASARRWTSICWGSTYSRHGPTEHFRLPLTAGGIAL